MHISPSSIGPLGVVPIRRHSERARGEASEAISDWVDDKALARVERRIGFEAGETWRSARVAAATRSPMDAHIELTLPAQTEYLYLVRLHVGAVASQIDMTLEVVEDLHLAAEELCMSLLSLSRSVPDRLAVGIAWDAEAIEITCRLGGKQDHGESGSWTNEGFPVLISQRLLDALVDEHTLDVEGDPPTAWLRKRRERPLPRA
jgi:hypothetical protein